MIYKIRHRLSNQSEGTNEKVSFQAKCQGHSINAL